MVIVRSLPMGIILNIGVCVCECVHRHAKVKNSIIIEHARCIDFYVGKDILNIIPRLLKMHNTAFRM